VDLFWMVMAGRTVSFLVGAHWWETMAGNAKGKSLWREKRVGVGQKKIGAVARPLSRVFMAVGLHPRPNQTLSFLCPRVNSNKPKRIDLESKIGQPARVTLTNARPGGPAVPRAPPRRGWRQPLGRPRSPDSSRTAAPRAGSVELQVRALAFSTPFHCWVPPAG
jgi:hypothetical protein